MPCSRQPVSDALTNVGIGGEDDGVRWWGTIDGTLMLTHRPRASIGITTTGIRETAARRAPM